MSIKQDIVVVNEFSVKTPTGGTRGGTPGDYVARYMARDGATEDLTPVRFDDADVFIERYMTRRSATESLTSIPEIKSTIADIDGLGGVAFCENEVSMSHSRVKHRSREIQEAFDAGKTVLKTVLSFDEDYLRKTGIIDEDFVCTRVGDYRGNIDQMKLRLAITRGMARMGGFDDLKWIGVIQVDTEHVHCHLCGVDIGQGRLMYTGEQKGKLDARQIRSLRRGIDFALDEMSPVRMMASNIGYDRRNVKCFVKRFCHATMDAQGLPQFLLSCLPADTRLWRASTNRAEMRKANSIVRSFVEEVFAQPDSGYSKAMDEIGKYAEARASREELTGAEMRALIDNGRRRMVEDCMNGVYATLRSIPKEIRNVRTPVLDVMSMDMTQAISRVQDSSLVEFGVRLRSFSTRLNHHKAEARKYRENRIAYEDAVERGEADVSAAPLGEFYSFEEEYNRKLVAKYRHFLSFLPRSDAYEDELASLLEYKSRITTFERILADSSVPRMQSDESAEAYVQDTYGVSGGALAKSSPQIIEQRVAAMQQTLARRSDELSFKAAQDGLVLDEELNLGVGVEYDFDDVKALDLHHLGYDWFYDVDVSAGNVKAFVDTAVRRHELFEGAVDYLERSGQGEYIESLSVRDIESMMRFATDLPSTGIIQSQSIIAGGKRGASPTIRLDVDFSKEIKGAVEATIAAIEMES